MSCRVTADTGHHRNIALFNDIQNQLLMNLLDFTDIAEIAAQRAVGLAVQKVRGQAVVHQQTDALMLQGKILAAQLLNGFGWIVARFKGGAQH